MVDKFLQVAAIEIRGSRMVRVSKSFDHLVEMPPAEPFAQRKPESGLTPFDDVAIEHPPAQHLDDPLVRYGANLQMRRQSEGPFDQPKIQKRYPSLQAARHGHPVHSVQRAPQIGQEFISTEARDRIARDDGF